MIPVLVALQIGRHTLNPQKGGLDKWLRGLHSSAYGSINRAIPTWASSGISCPKASSWKWMWEIAEYIVYLYNDVIALSGSTVFVFVDQSTQTSCRQRISNYEVFLTARWCASPWSMPVQVVWMILFQLTRMSSDLLPYIQATLAFVGCTCLVFFSARRHGQEGCDCWWWTGTLTTLERLRAVWMALISLISTARSKQQHVQIDHPTDLLSLDWMLRWIFLYFRLMVWFSIYSSSKTILPACLGRSLRNMRVIGAWL